MYQCSKNQVTYKEYNCFDHSDFSVHSMFTSGVCMCAEIAWALVSSGTQVQPQVILDPDYLPDYLFVSNDYVLSYFDYNSVVYWKRTFSYYLGILKNVSRLKASSLLLEYRPVTRLRWFFSRSYSTIFSRYLLLRKALHVWQSSECTSRVYPFCLYRFGSVCDSDMAWDPFFFFLLSFNFKCLLNFNTNKSIVLSSGKKGVAIVASAPTVS